MIVDAHAHVFFLEGMVDYYNKPLFEYMAINRIDICSCIAATKNENEGVIKSVTKHSDKLFGIGYVNVHDQISSLSFLHHYYKLGIFRGIKMHPYVEDYQLDDPMIFPVYETCLELDIPLLFHTGWLNFNNWPSDEPGKFKEVKASCTGFPVQFANVLERYPKLKIIFAHFGGNYYREILGLTERFENVYMDTAWLRHYADRMLPPVTLNSWIEHAVKFVGSKKILFAGEGTLPSDIEQCNLTIEQKEDIFFKNAVSLYKI